MNKSNKQYLDEGISLYPEPTKELKEHMKRIHILQNQHRLAEDGSVKPSAIHTQSMKDFDKH